MKKTGNLLAILLISCSVICAQNIKPIADKTKIHIGERITLTFGMPSRGEIIPPEKIKTDTLEMLSITHSITEKNGKDYAMFRAVFTSFKEGEHCIPSITIIDFDTSTQKETKFFTDSIKFIVIPYPVDTAKVEIKGIKPIIEERFTMNEILPLIWLSLTIIIVALCFWVFFRFLKRRKHYIPKIISKPVITEPADVKALRELEKLRISNNEQRMIKKQYYSQMTDILRTFLYEGFGINAMEMTTTEIIYTIQNQFKYISNRDEIANLKQILSLADLVKFAKYEADDFTDDKCFNLSKNFIINTTLKQKETIDVQ